MPESGLSIDGEGECNILRVLYSTEPCCQVLHLLSSRKSRRADLGGLATISHFPTMAQADTHLQRGRPVCRLTKKILDLDVSVRPTGPET